MLTNKQTNDQTELHLFQKEPSYDGDLCPCQVGIQLDKQFSSWSPEMKMWTDRQTDKKLTNESAELHPFRKNLAIVVIYLPVKFEFDWTNHFRVRVRKRNCGRTDGWTDKRTKNGQTNGRNYTNFERNLAMMVIYLRVKFKFNWTNRFQVPSPEMKMWTESRMDRQTDKQTDGISPISKGT